MARPDTRGTHPGRGGEGPLDALATTDADAPDAAPLLPTELKSFGDRAGRMKQWPVRWKLQRIAAGYLATRFELGVHYRERDVNAILQDWHTFNDWARLRRLLVDWGYLEREADGSRYWRVGEPEPSILGTEARLR